MKRRSFLKGTLATAPLLLSSPTLSRADDGKGGPRVPHNIGPSTKTESYLLPSLPGVETVSILTVGDSVGAFTLGSPDFLTQDEESSGLIDARRLLGDGWFLLTVQVHRPSPDPELVEGGQLLALFVDKSIGRAGGGNDDDLDEDAG